MVSKLGVLSLVVLLLVGGISACKKTHAEDLSGGPAAAPSVSTAPRASAGGDHSSLGSAVSEVFEVSGVAKSARTANLSAKGSGILRSIKVREGDRVKSGQMLAQLDTTDVRLRSEAASVAFAQSQESIVNAKDDLDRATMLFDAGAVPDQVVNKAQLAMRVAKLQSQAAEVGMRQAKQSLVDSSLIAPFDGVITRVLAEEGQMITTMPPVVIFVLSDTDSLEVRVPIPERRLAEVHVGTPVRVHLPAVNVHREAKVDRLSDVIDLATRSTEAIIRLPNKDRALPAGLFAKVSFPGIRADGVTVDAGAGAMASEKGN